MSTKSMLQWLGLGAGLMYLWDPQQGRRRRTELINQWEHTKHCTQDFFDKAQRDLNNRASGIAAQATSMLGTDEASDQVIDARVRAKIGRYCSHPHAIKVQMDNGHVVLSGPILTDEVAGLLHAIRWVRGVKGIGNQLECHAERGNISALQGGVRPVGEHVDFLQDHWSPATRAIGQAVGVTLMANCLVRRSAPAIVLGTAGCGLFLRSTFNQSLMKLLGLQAGSHALRLQRTVSIHAPVEKVWDFITDFEHLADFLPIVNSVEELGDNRYLWGFQLPGGKDLKIEERVTEAIPHQRLTWESVGPQPVTYSGSVNLHPQGDGVTQVNVDLHYTPPGGAVSKTLASLFGVDTESKFHEAVMRIKPYLESGIPPRDMRRSHRASQPARQTEDG